MISPSVTICGWRSGPSPPDLTQFWVSNDLFLRSCPVILAAVATATRTIEIGTCILNPYTLNPAEIAMMAATLDEVSGGRFNLGLSSGSGDFLAWVGIDRRPAAHRGGRDRARDPAVARGPARGAPGKLSALDG